MRAFSSAPCFGSLYITYFSMAFKVIYLRICILNVISWNRNDRSLFIEKNHVIFIIFDYFSLNCSCWCYYHKQYQDKDDSRDQFLTINFNPWIEYSWALLTAIVQEQIYLNVPIYIIFLALKYIVPVVIGTVAPISTSISPLYLPFSHIFLLSLNYRSKNNNHNDSIYVMIVSCILMCTLLGIF